MRGLLDRLVSGDRAIAVEESVLENIRLILNTQLGDAPSAPELGIPDLSDIFHDVPDAWPVLQQMIRNAIAKYEPRVSSVRVRPHPASEPLELALEISIRISGGPARPLRISTSIDSSGRFQFD